MTWTKLLASKEAQRHKTSKKELDNRRALIARDLADSAIAGLSADRKFATAYNAALQAANMAIACAGYRIVSKVGHHRLSLESTKLVLGKPAHKYVDYFETCRRKRNTIDYTFSIWQPKLKRRRSLSKRPSFTAMSKTGLPRTIPRSFKRVPSQRSQVSSQSRSGFVSRVFDALQKARPQAVS